MLIDNLSLYDIWFEFTEMQSAIQKDASVSVCRVRWNHEGTLFGDLKYHSFSLWIKKNIANCSSMCSTDWIEAESLFWKFAIKKSWHLFFNFFAGVAYSKHIVQLFSYHGRDEIIKHREVTITLLIQSLSFRVLLFLNLFLSLVLVQSLDFHVYIK